LSDNVDAVVVTVDLGLDGHVSAESFDVAGEGGELDVFGIALDGRDLRLGAARRARDLGLGVPV